ncbi:MAG: hypothetical protein ACKO7A_05345, partial [Microcystis sp.]
PLGSRSILVGGETEGIFRHGDNSNRFSQPIEKFDNIPPFLIPRFDVFLAISPVSHRWFFFGNVF